MVIVFLSVYSFKYVKMGGISFFVLGDFHWNFFLTKVRLSIMFDIGLLSRQPDRFRRNFESAQLRFSRKGEIKKESVQNDFFFCKALLNVSVDFRCRRNPGYFTPLSRHFMRNLTLFTPYRLVFKPYLSGFMPNCSQDLILNLTALITSRHHTVPLLQIPAKPTHAAKLSNAIISRPRTKALGACLAAYA